MAELVAASRADWRRLMQQRGIDETTKRTNGFHPNCRRSAFHSVAVKVDVTNRAGLAPALNKVESELGPIGILVNDAGNVSLSGGVLNESSKIGTTSSKRNSTQCFSSKLAAKSMVPRKRGKIINIGSMYSYFGSGLIPSYSAAKGAIVQLTKSMAIELASHNIQVNAIAPGWIETEMTAPVKTMPLNDEILVRTPAGRWGQPEEVAGTAVYLASRASDFVTGTTIRVRRRECEPVTFRNLTNARKTIHLR